ncbi:MAG: 2-oxo acid dehydrogenase subunit E2, partial [Proteobacteria bacterium]|nr:2-oxo acid dehydrogenase subunit E2 [Pseudomonadota bacterium]
GKHFTPIINSPEVAILGLGRGYAAPLFKENKFEKQMVMPTALSYDHRLIDGAQAARFMLALGDALNQFTDKDVSF